MADMPTRLGPEDWLDAGLDALVEAGPEALKAEPLARVLATTKGSFYWHFKDITDFRSRLLGRWKDAARAALSNATEMSASPAERLQHIEAVAAPAGTGIEAAIRSWARAEPEVRAALREIDAARLAYIRAVLAGLGLTNPDFARLTHAALIGLGETGEPGEALSTLTASFLALKEA